MKTVKAQPLGNRVIIEPDPIVNETASGIILSAVAPKDPPAKGVVVATGTKCEHISVGDHVLYGKYSGTEIELEEKGTFVTMREDDVMCIIP